MSFKGLALAAFFGMAAYSSAALRISEVYINPPGGSDPGQGREFIEIFNDGTSGVSLNGKSLVLIENEGGSAGTIDLVFALPNITLAAGKKLVIRDVDALGDPAFFDPDYSVSNPPVEVLTDLDLENEGGNYFIADNVTGTVGTNLDTNDNGVLDSQPWGTVYDWVTIHEGQSGDSFNYSPNGAGYQTVVTWTGFESPANPANPDVFARIYTWNSTTSSFTAVAEGVISEVTRTGDQNTFISSYRATNGNALTVTGINRVSPGATGALTGSAVFSVTYSSNTYYHP